MRPEPAMRDVPRLSLSRAEVAYAIGVSPNTIDVMVQEGALPPPRRWHSRTLWLVHEISAAMMDWPTRGGEPISPGSGADDNYDWRAS